MLRTNFALAQSIAFRTLPEVIKNLWLNLKLLARLDHQIPVQAGIVS